ncbi:HB2C protein, partial [Rhabdornis inornatus]|nr:HB2C protein [Rhabdornis inornatus]
GAPPVLCPAHTGVFHRIFKAECYFIKGTEKMRYVTRYIYNWKELMRFDSDVGLYMVFTPYGEKWARCLTSKPAELELRRKEVDRFCRSSYELSSPFLAERRIPPTTSQSIPSPSQ